VKRFAVMLPLLLLISGCGDTWDKLTSWDGWWGHDRSVSAERTPVAVPDTPAQSRAGAQPLWAGPAPAGDGCYRGKLTNEGHTCQAMRTENGGLLTLAGPLRGFGTGDSVCVCGVPATQQFCKQGLTFLIRDISDTCANIQ